MPCRFTASRRQLPARLAPNSPNYIGNLEMLVKKYRDGLTTALEDIKPEDLTTTVTRMIKSSQHADSPKTADGDGADGRAQRPNRRATSPTSFSI